MIKVSSNVSETSVRLGAWVSKMRGAGRKLLYSAAANAVAILVRAHLSRLGSWKHASADRLGAEPTGFLQKASRGTVSTSDTEKGEVIIPYPLGRAFHDVEIRPRQAGALTIPAAAESYGKRANVLAAHGWTIFRPKGKNVLMGSIRGEDAKVLYWLRAAVKQAQDRELLPSDADLGKTAAAATMAAIRRLAS